MAPDSSHEEIKRAFTTRALKYHPDRQPDAEAAEHAAWRMREISEAWATLRSPSSRAAYDAKLQGEADLVVPIGAGIVSVGSGYIPTERSFHPGGSAWFSEPEVADIEPIEEQTAATEPPRRFTRWHLGPLAVGGATLLIVLVLLVRTNNYDNRPDVLQTQEKYATGACVSVAPNLNGEQTATEVPCSASHTGRIQSKVDFPRSCPLQTRIVVLVSEKISLCLQA